MEWNAAVWWWIAAGGLVAAELATGSFYLLMIALGCAAGALAAHAGFSAPMQVVTAAVVGAAATALWHARRARRPNEAAVEHNRDVNLDIGSPVQVVEWTGDGTARVAHRGATWSARYEGPGHPAPGPHVIVAIRGSELGLAPAAHRV